MDGKTPATSFANFGAGNDQRDPDSEIVLSAWAGDDWQIGPRAQLDLAVRVDAYRDFNPSGSTDRQTPPAINPRIALLIRPYDAGRTKLLFGRAFRLPGFYERYFSDGGISQVRAHDLRPEVVYTGEIEHAHQINDEVSVTLAGYLSEMRDLIGVGSPPDQPTISQFQNRPHPTHAAGGEIELRWQAAPGFLFSGWYAFSLVREDPGAWFSGSPLPNSPQSTGALRALFPVVPQALSLSSELMYGGPRRSIPNADGSAAVLGEFLLWNIGLAGEHRRLRYGAFVTNLLDQRPVLPAGPEISFANHGVPQYGRMLRLTMAASF
jgi:outer membrane receptor protein involved in Fe transport